MITITLNIQIFKRYFPPVKTFKVIELDDNTYINKFARVERGEENLSVATGSQCLGIAMLEARYISQYYRILPSGNSKQ